MTNKKIIYVSGHYRGDGKPNTIYNNIQKARIVSERLWSEGWVVLTPHLNTAFLDGVCSDDVWLEGDLLLLERCADAIYMLKGWETSSGACDEHAHACEKDIRVIYE